MKEDTTIIDLAHEVVERFSDRQARTGLISAQELDYAVLAQEVIDLNQQLTEKDATIDELWGSLQWTLSALTMVTAGEPVFNLDEVIANATRTLQEQERHAALGEGDKE